MAWMVSVHTSCPMVRILMPFKSSGVLIGLFVIK